MSCLSHGLPRTLLSSSKSRLYPSHAAQELAELNEEEVPETTEQFERLVVAQPDVSYVWVKYMAFLLSLGDIAGARAVVERALKTINYRCRPWLQ